MILSLDTSTRTLSMALTAVDGPRRTLVEHVTIGPPDKLSQVLPGAIGTLLGRHQLKASQLTAFVVGVGPGSFTGLRISLAAVKGLAYAVKVPVTGVSSLRAVALEGPEGVELFSSAVVKKGELYLGRYRRQGRQVESLADEAALTVDAFAEQLKQHPEALALGPAMVEYAAALQQRGIAAERLITSVAFPSAVCLGELATLPERYDEQAVFALEPHYLRTSGAEDNPKFPPLPDVPAQSRLKEE